MTTQMSKEQQEVRNASTFRQRYTTLSQAGIGVILCRTREPFRAIETLKDQASADHTPENPMAFKSWSVSKGWETFDVTKPDADPVGDDATKDPAKALQSLSDRKWTDGIYVMMYPHKMIAQSSLMVQMIKEYVRLFTQVGKRLVLLTPLGYSLPTELEDDVVILDFDVPSYAERLDSLQGLIESVKKAEHRPKYSAAETDRILAAGAGMTSHEFENAVARSLIENKQMLPAIPIEAFVGEVMKTKIEVVKRSEVLEVMPLSGIENVGGLENLKLWIRKRASCFGQDARDFGVEAPKGIALIGPPGTGKSLASKAIGSVLGLPLIKFDVSRVFQSLVGQSEERVRGALKMVEAMAPCVLMIDEVDKAFNTNSGGGDSGVGQRVLGAMLTWMQETKAPVFVVVTANRTAGLPAEFLRRGRLDEIFSVTVPHPGERMEILKIHLKNRGQDPAKISDLMAAVLKSEGYVAAEIEAAVKDAIIEAYTTAVDVTGGLIAQQLSFMKPLSEAFKTDFEAMQSWAEDNARPASLEVGETVEKPAGVRSRSRVNAGAAVPRGGRSIATAL
jgi:AAA+ superfamily predicted ATPase